MAGATQHIVLAVTGATGMLYVPALLALLADAGVEVHGVISRAGRQVLALELELEPTDLAGIGRWYDVDDFTAPMASGSCPYDAMVILPCTMGTLAAIASGVSSNLIHRAADVMLKERRPLLLAARETPLNRTHLKNMLAVHDAGGIICPPMPSFYTRPADLPEMARNFAGRICDQLRLPVSGIRRWQGTGN